MRVESPDYYSILSVPFGATQDQIERAYKFLVRMSHPDAFATTPQAQECGQRANEADQSSYDVLKDPSTRAEYDRQYATRKSEQGAPRQSRTEGARIRCPLCEGRA